MNFGREGDSLGPAKNKFDRLGPVLSKMVAFCQPSVGGGRVKSLPPVDFWLAGGWQDRVTCKPRAQIQN